MGRIIRVHIENFKKIEHLDKNIDGESIFLMGDNEVGKSSFIQAVFGLLSNTKFPEKSITKDKESGMIEVEFVANNKRYTATKKFTAKNPKGYFEIKTEDGLSTSSVSFLSSIVGNISFNPFEFVEMSKTANGRRKQVAFLRQLLSDDVNSHIDDIDLKRKQDFESRTDGNKYIRDLESNISEIKLPKTPERYSEKIIVAKELQAYREADRKNKAFNECKKSVDFVSQQKEQLQNEIDDLEDKINAKKSLMKSLSKDETTYLDELQGLKLIDLEPLRKKIERADSHNKNFESIEKHRKLSKKLSNYQKRMQDLTNSIESLMLRKTEIISNSDLPIKNLTFDDESLYLNGMVLDESQVSTSQIIEVGVKLAVALNPNLKIISIPRGESLGSKRLQSIKEFADKHGYQLFIEKVQAGLQELTIQAFES